MKTQIEINDELWNAFKAKVNGDGKTLREVVPTVLEPALRAYIEPTTITPSDALQAIPLPQKAIPEPPVVRRCELCDMPSERLFASGPYKVCYNCWKGALTNPQPNTAQ